MSCPCCEDDYVNDDELDELQPGDNHVAFSGGAVVYPNAGGGSYVSRQRHATLAKRRGAATKTVVVDLSLRDHFIAMPMPMAEKGPIEYRSDDGAITAAGGLCAPFDADWSAR